MMEPAWMDMLGLVVAVVVLVFTGHPGKLRNLSSEERMRNRARAFAEFDRMMKKKEKRRWANDQL